MQLGVMYMLSFRAYLYLTVSELLLFTVLTPLYITLIYDIISKRRLRWGYAFSALLAVIGAGLFAMIRSPTISGLACCWCNSQYHFCHWHGGLQTPDGNSPDATA